MAFIQQALQYVEPIVQVLGYLVILATIAAKFFPGAAPVAGKGESLFVKAIQFLPTLGINPRTKALQAALEEVKQP